MDKPTNWIELIFSLATLAAVVYSRYLSYKAENENKQKLEDVHTIVNSQRTAMINKIEELRTLLRGEEKPLVKPPSSDVPKQG
jgi:hypothetical protein